MKTSKIFLPLTGIVIVLFVLQLNAQYVESLSNAAKSINTDGSITVTLGTGTNTNSTQGVPTPYGTYYKNFRQQYLILASELLQLGIGAGNITSLGFNVASVNTCLAMPNYKIDMKHTNVSSLSTTFENSGYTTVYTNASFLPVTGWNTHNFSTPFNWNGTSNLLIDICTTLIPGSYTTNASVFYTPTIGNTCARFQSDSYAACQTTSAATVSNYRANMQITGENNVAPFISVTPNSLNFGYIPNGNSSELSYILSGTNLSPTAGNILITAPANFEVSETSGSGFAGSISVIYSGGSLTKTIYVKFAPTGNPSNYIGNITNVGVGSSANVAVSGTSDVFMVYCTSMASSTADEEIYSVTINGANNTYNCTTAAPGPGSILNRYSNFWPLGSLTTLHRGIPVNFTIIEDECDGATYYSNGCAIWIDFNQDGDFLDAGEQVYSEAGTTISPRTISGTITAPLTATLGVTAMRITVAEGVYGAALTPCLAYSYGETEDYKVTISTATTPYLTVTPTSLNFGIVPSGITSSELSYLLTGGNLVPTAGNITATPPTNFEVSTTTGGPYSAAPITLAYSGGIVNHTIYTVFKPTAPNTIYNGTITNVGGGGSANVSVTGTSPCEPFTAPYLEQFTTWPPNCWNLTGGTYSWIQYNTGIQCAEAYFSYQSAGNTDVMTTNTIDVSSLSNPALKFDWSHLYNAYYPNDTLKILISDDYGISWTLVLTLGGINFNSNDGATYSTPGTFVSSNFIDLKPFDNLIQIKFFGKSGYGPDLFIDNVVIMESTCDVPINLNAINIAKTEVDLTWTSFSGSSDIEIGLSGFTPSGNPTHTIVVSPFHKDGLNPNTSYDFYVRDDCGYGLKSEWVGPFNFNTQSLMLNVKAFLEGPYQNGAMSNSLNIGDHIPLTQPYNVRPWYYNGNEGVQNIPSSTIVDWILVELLEPIKTGDLNLHVLAQRAGFILEDGSITDLDGISPLEFSSINQNLNSVYVRVFHRNHFAVLSSEPLAYDSGILSYDFTVSENMSIIGTSSQKQLESNVWGLVSGDADGDSQIDNLDKNDNWIFQNGLTGYLSCDFNMDGNVNENDKTYIWMPNSGKGIDFPITFKCGDRIIDERDGKYYNTVEIGTQCWMAKNINLGTFINGNQDQQDNLVLEKYCYDDNPTNCDTYGGLYQWDEMMQYDTSRFTKGICPEGWHLPTVDEWNTLIETEGGMQLAGDSLITGGNSGFDALFGGYMDYNGIFVGLNNESYFWNSVNKGDVASYYHLISTGSVVDSGYADKVNGYSVRCIQGLSPSYSSNVVVIDTTVYELISDSLQLAQGTYIFQVNQSKLKNTDLINVFDIIVGSAKEGYLRKVVEFVQNGSTIILHTIQATMEELFQFCDFSHTSDLSNLTPGKNSWNNSEITYLAKGVSQDVTDDGGFQYNFNNVELYQNGPIDLKISDGHLIFEPNFKFDLKCQNNKVKRLAFYTEDALLETDVNLNLTVNQAVQLIDNEELLASYKKIIGWWVGPIPVVAVINLDINVVTTLDVDATFNATLGYTNTNTIDIGCKYEYGNWSGIFDINPVHSFDPLNMSGMVNVELEVALVPEIRFALYGVAGPYFNTSLYEDFKGNIVSPSLDWDANLDIGLNAKVGADVTIFGNTFADYNHPIEGFNHSLWSAPDKLVLVSGNNQTGWVNWQLENPIIVKVLDNLDQAVIGIPVHFQIIQGGGTVSIEDILTDGNGIAQTFWTMGPNQGLNQLSAQVVKANGSNIINSPLILDVTAITAPTVITGDVLSFDLYDYPGFFQGYTAEISGNVIDDGGSYVYLRGIQRTGLGDDCNSGTGPGYFSCTISGVEYAGSLVYYNAFACTNYGGCMDGDIKTILLPPYANINEISFISQHSLEFECYSYGVYLDQKGVCWDTEGNPTIEDNYTNEGSGEGDFYTNIYNLSPGTYYFRAYAINSSGICYDIDISVRTITE